MDMMMDLHSMNDKTGTLYKAVWDNESLSTFSSKIRKTIWNGKESDHSYSFDVGNDVEKGLADIFEIENEEQFQKKYLSVISGDGHEEKRISVLHSSALCSLLFFYSVTPEHPVRLTIQGEDVEFTDTEFEYKSRVIEGRRASNVDVVLISRDKKTVLFLESKFSEYYLHCNKVKLFSQDYLDETKCRYAEEVYRDSALMRKMGITVCRENENDMALRSEEPAYLEGIKQMISHYVGIRNRIDSVSASVHPQNSVPAGHKNDVVTDAIANGANVYLEEILFDRGIEALEIIPGKPCFAAYEAMYRELAHGLNASIEKNMPRGHFHVVCDLFRYSKLEDCGLINDRIRTFYFGK